jgi:hypothetical protein
MLSLLRILDKATGYIFLPPSQPTSLSSDPSQPSPPKSTSTTPNAASLFSSISGPVQGGRDVRDVQERWIDDKEVFDEFEREEWRKEGLRASNRRANLGEP